MKKIIIFAALCLSFQTACDKEDLGGSNIHVPEFDYNALSETDKYIYDHYTVPYNVEVVYRWNQGDVSSDDMRMEEIGMFHFTVSIRHPGFPVTGKNRIRHERQKEGLHGNTHPANRYI